MQEIKVTLSTALKQKPQDESQLGFGRIFTDHMFLMNYEKGKGWYDPRIVPYGDFAMDPASMVLHYGQAIFEGTKAYRRADGGIQLFRPDKNIERMNNTCDRLCVPRIDPDLALEAIKAVVDVDKDWVPHSEGTSLYIRPFIIATDAFLGVHASHSYIFCIILSPVGSYYANGMDPVKIYIEREYVRCVKGGTGMAKAGGNYAASLIGQEKADKMGYAQVLWLDGVERKYIEEVGAMNVMFKINGEVITPALSGSILPGITRKSCIEVLRSQGYKVTERLLSIEELEDAMKNGTLEEAWGCGTAAVVSPIGELCYKDQKFVINNGQIGTVTQFLYDTLTGIQWGKIEDEFNWIYPIK